MWLFSICYGYLLGTFVGNYFNVWSHWTYSVYMQSVKCVPNSGQLGPYISFHTDKKVLLVLLPDTDYDGQMATVIGWGRTRLAYNGQCFI